MTTPPAYPKVRVVPQRRVDDCSICTVAMITGAEYEEVWKELAPPPTDEEVAKGYNERENQFLNKKGWWASLQVLFPNPLSFEELRSVIYYAEDPRVMPLVESADRVRLVLEFKDGKKPDHGVVTDEKETGNNVYDPSLGLVPKTELFVPHGDQTYGGIVGFTAFVYQPDKPIETLVVTSSLE